MKLENNCDFFLGKVATWKPLEEYTCRSVFRALLLVEEMTSFFDFILAKHKSFPPTDRNSSQFPSIFQYMAAMFDK